MKRLQAFLLITLAGWPSSLAWAADARSIDSFLGRWSGDKIQSGDNKLAPAALDLQIDKDAGGFAISWHDLGKDGGDRVEARFQPTDRPGVYEVAPESGSFLARMFASPASGNPLKGETLLWARIDDPVLAVYSMSVDPTGGIDLQHYTWTRTENGLHLTFSHRTDDDGDESPIEGDLVAAGG
ncbi:MAG: hypothetical protein R3F54_09365 [Alphaproteobacteria bacterium]